MSSGPTVHGSSHRRHWPTLYRDLLRDSVAFSGIATRFPDDVSLEPTAPHPFFGPLHCRAWFLFQRVHDQDHARHVGSIKQAAGYPG